MKLYQVHRNVVLIGIAGFCFILVAFLDSLHFRTAANWYFGKGFMVLVHHDGELSLMHSNLPVPWNPKGFSGQTARDAFPTKATVGNLSASSISETNVKCHFMEIPHWGMLVAFISCWSGLLVADHFVKRSSISWRDYRS